MRVTLTKRVEQLERNIETLTSRRGSDTSEAKTRSEKLWDGAQPFLVALIPSLVLFWVGYSFQESIKQDIEERKVGVQSVKEIRELIHDLLLNAEADPKKAESAALAIAAFGRHSVVPLLTVIETGGINKTAGAQRGLVAAGLIDRKYTCKVLVDILDRRAQRYTSIMHRQIIRSMTDIGCVGADGHHGELALQRYRTLLDAGATALSEALSDSSNPDAAINLRVELDRAVKLLQLDGKDRIISSKKVDS